MAREIDLDLLMKDVYKSDLQKCLEEKSDLATIADNPPSRIDYFVSGMLIGVLSAMFFLKK